MDNSTLALSRVMNEDHNVSKSKEEVLLYDRTGGSGNPAYMKTCPITLV